VIVGEEHQDKEAQVSKDIKVEDEDTSERFPSLAKPEESENECDPEPCEKLLLYENFESEACEECFKILEDNAEQFAKQCCAEKTCTLEDPSLKETDTFDETATKNEKACKFLHNIDFDSSGSFRASVHSVSTCHESLPSSRACPTKGDLYLDLDLECRICHDAEGQDLISPCHCAGTSKWVHESCIIKWIRHTKTKQCEICTCPITVKRKKKPIEQVRKARPRVYQPWLTRQSMDSHRTDIMHLKTLPVLLFLQNFPYYRLLILLCYQNFKCYINQFENSEI
jgi:hypothetical protein